MTSRDLFRATVADLAAQAKATLPENAGRIDAAVMLVLAGDVALQPDGTATVGSATHPMSTYSVNGTCNCPDFARAPDGWCKHRLGRALQLRTDRALRAALDAEASRMPQEAPSCAQVSTPTPADEDPAWAALAPSRGEMSASEVRANDEKGGRATNASGGDVGNGSWKFGPSRRLKRTSDSLEKMDI